jgi:hypothetical protein
MSQVTFITAPDTMARLAALDYDLRIPFMGLWTSFRSNCESVIQDAERLFGQWRRLGSDLVTPGPELTVDIVVHPENAADFGSVPLQYRIRGPYLTASRSADMLFLDSDRGAAAAFITPETAANADGVLRQILRSVGLNIALGHDRSPMHAAGVVGLHHALLLAGPSGAGKSTLCYACVREGMRILGEDAVFASLERGVRLWQCLPDIHLAEELTEWFPELSGYGSQLLKGDGPEICVETGDWGTSRSCLSTDQAVFCTIERREAAETVVEPIPKRAVVDALLSRPEPGFDLSRRAGEVAEALAETGGYRVFVGHDLGRAVAALRGLSDVPR